MWDLRDAFRLPVRQCGNCDHWFVSQIGTNPKHGAREAPCLLNVVQRDAPIKTENPTWHRGSDTCGKWAKEIKL